MIKIQYCLLGEDMINTEEKRKLTEEKMNILEEELNKLFTSGTITLLKIKGFIYSVSVTTGVILLEAILDIDVVSNPLINILYIISTVGIPTLMFGNPFKNKKKLKNIQNEITEIVDIKIPSLKNQLTNLEQKKGKESPKVTTNSPSFQEDYSLENDIYNPVFEKKGPVLKLSRDKKYTNVNKD